MSYLEDYIQKLNSLPEGTNKHLRHIRDLDKKVEAAQAELRQQQNNFIEKFRRFKGKKIDHKWKQSLENQLQEIKKKHKQLYNMAYEKVKISEQLYQLVHEPTEKLQTDLKKLQEDLQKSGMIDEFDEEKDFHHRRKRNKYDRKNHQKFEQNKQYADDLVEPKYCYCSKTSFGEMVMCDNPLCVKQWFHLECVQQKNFGDKWFCSDCRKGKEKMKIRNNGH